MSQKARRILGIYAAAAIAMLAVYSCVSHVRLENYRLIAKYSSQRAFEETAASVQELSEALGKGVYAVDAGMCAQVCSDIQAAAQSAEAAMATLPFTTQELSRTAGFLGTAGDYAMSLARQDGEFTGEQRETLRSLSDKASEFSALLQELRGSINDGEVMIDRQERRLQNVGEDGGVTLSARLTEYEGDFEMPDLPEYEGRYTASETARSGDLDGRACLGHHNGRLTAELRSGKSHALGVVARGGGDQAPGLFLLGQGADLIVGPPYLICSGDLHVLRL